MSNAAREDPRVVVLICCYNGRHHLDDCLGSLTENMSTSCAVRVLVIDNASTDGSGDYVREHFPAVDVVQIEPNQGFAGGNNRGWEHIQQHWPEAEFVYLLNVDTKVGSNWLEPLLRFMEEHPRCGAVQPKIMLFDRPNVINTVGNRSHYLGFGMMTGYGEEDCGQYDEPRQWSFPSGCAVLLRTDPLRELGLFDGSFYMTLEDADLGWKLRLAGWEVWSQPEAVIYHKYKPDSPLRLYEYLERNRWVLLLTYYKRRTLLLLSPALAAMEAGQLLFSVLNGCITLKVKSWVWFWRRTNMHHVSLRRDALRPCRRLADRAFTQCFVGEVWLPTMTPFALRRLGNPLLQAFWSWIRHRITW